MSIKTKRALVSVMLTVLLIIALFFVIMNVDAAHNGVAFADHFLIGSGTEESPYQIWEKDDLQEFYERSQADGTIWGVLKQSVDMEDTVWDSQIGGDSYSGTFNGGGYAISGLNLAFKYDLTIGGDVSYGLFAPLNSNGVVRDLTVNGSCTFTTTSALDEAGTLNFGGITGINEAGSIENCTVQLTTNALINNSNRRFEVIFGGIAGTNNSAITGCVFEGELHADNGPGNDNLYVGGITGINAGGSSISTSINAGTVYGSSTNCYAGGIAGWNHAEIDRSASEGYVEAFGGIKSYAGGIAGISKYYYTGHPIIFESYNGGFVTAISAGNAYAAGIAAENNAGNVEMEIDKAKIEKCYNSGKVLAKGQDVTYGLSGNCYAAGIAYDNKSGAIIIDSYNSGDVTATGGANNGYKGEAYGLVGSNDSTSVIKFVYNCAEITAIGETKKSSWTIGYNANNTEGAVVCVYFISDADSGDIPSSTIGSRIYTDYMDDASEYKDDDETYFDFANTWVETYFHPVLADVAADVMRTATKSWIGSSSNPLNIDTAAAFAQFSDYVNNGNSDVYGIVTRNIYLCGSDEKQWTPIGSSNNPYTGRFTTSDDKPKYVKGLYIDGSDEYVGLFGRVSDGGTWDDPNYVKNLLVTGTVTGKNYVGGICGKNSGTISYCGSKVFVKGTSYVGGIAGYNDTQANINHCYNSGRISGSNAGGITGKNTNVIAHCYNTGTMDGTSYVGGIAGETTTSAISYCHAYGNVPNTGSFIGQFVGKASGGNISYNYALTRGADNIQYVEDDNELTAEQYRVLSNFENFSSDWEYSGINGSKYPVLIGLPDMIAEAHRHVFEYFEDENNHNAILAICTANNCDLPNNTASMFIVEPDDKVYDGDPHYAEIKTDYDVFGFTPTITYTQYGSEVTPINAGTYTASFEYGSLYAYLDFTIEKAQFVTVVSITGWTYGETKNSPSVSANPENGAVTYKYKLATEPDSAYNTTKPTNAGEYKVKATIAETTNHKSASAETTFTIARATYTPTVTINGWAFGGYTPVYNDPQVHDSEGEEETFFYKVKGADDSTYTEDRPTNAGEYTVKAVISATTNYEEAECTADFEITKSAPTITIANWEYNSTPNTPSSPGGGELSNIEYKVKGAADDTYTSTVPIAVGEYTVKADVATSSNCYSGLGITTDFVINKTTITPTVSIDDWTYGEDAKTPTVTGNIDSATETIEYKLASAEESEYSPEVPESAGDYSIRVTIAATDNCSSGTAENTFTIAKATLDITVSISDWTYGEEQSIPSVQGNLGGGAVTYEYSIDGSTYYPYPTQTVLTPTIYNLRANVAETDNYNAASKVTTFKVDKTEATVTIDNWTYGETASTATSPSGGTVLTVEYKVRGADDSTYTTTVPTTAGEYTLKAQIQASSTSLGGNATCDFEILKADFTPSVAIEGWKYKETASTPVLTNNVSGGDVTYEYKLASETETAYTTEVPQAPGDYTLRASIAATTNYNAQTCTTTFSIVKNVATLSINSWIYNQTPQEPTTDSDGVMSNILYKVRGADDSTYTTTVPTTAGEYTVRASISETENYYAGTPTADFEIIKAHYSPSVELAGWTFGEDPNEPVVVGNIESAVVTIEYKLETADDTAYIETVPTNAGNYMLRAHFAETTNYQEETVYTHFVIAKASATLSIEGWTYGETPNAPTTTSDGEMSNILYKVKGADDTYTSTVPTGAGKYTVKATIAETTNCSGGTLTADFEISKATFTPTLTQDGWTYGGTQPTPTLTGNVSGGAVTNKFKVKGADDSTYTTEVPQNAGEYTICAFIAETDNYYENNETTCDFEIYKKTINPSVGIDNWTYGETAKNPEFAGLEGGGTVTVEYKLTSADDTSYTTEVPTNAGNYTLRASIAQTSNYNAAVCGTTFVIEKANPKYTIPTDLTANVGELLSGVTLPSGFSWNVPDTKFTAVGTFNCIATFTPEDTDNYNIIDDIEIPVIAKWTIIDNEQEDISVVINGDTYDENIKLKVEVKTEIQESEKQGSTIAIQAKLDDNEEIAAIYEVKLLKLTIVNGVETTEEIQPSDIKEGTTITVSMKIPEELKGVDFKLLHIHSEEDIEYVSYTVSPSGDYITINVNRLSDFAFVIKNDARVRHGFCIGWIVFILDMLVLIFSACALTVNILVRGNNQKCKDIVDKMKMNFFVARRKMVAFILLCVITALFLFALIVLCLHVCPITIIAFIIALLMLIAIMIYFLLLFRIIKFDEDEEEEPQPKVEEPKAEQNKVEEQPIVEEDKASEEAVVQTETEAEKELEEEKDDTLEEIEAKEKAHEALTLKDSLVLAKATASSHRFTKKYVANYLRTKDIVEVNERPNYTSTGLPLADTHYVDGKNGKKCFTYVYETEGSIILLAKMDKEYAEKLQEKHSQINLSAFPKQKNTWYSLIIDDSYSKEEFEGILDDLIAQEKDDAGMSLKESIALAKANTSHTFSKKYVCELLKDRENVEVNTRENYTKTGLPLADTHYVTKNGKKICFAYVYEIEGSIILLGKMPTKYANGLKKKHPQVNLSAFPKQADTWYSLIIDDTYSKEEFDKIIEDLMEQA